MNIDLKGGFINTLDKGIKFFYMIVLVFFIWFIYNSLVNADLYSTGGFITFNTISCFLLIGLVLLINY